jgi:hypothetical protein
MRFDERDQTRRVARELEALDQDLSLEPEEATGAHMSHEEPSETDGLHFSKGFASRRFTEGLTEPEPRDIAQNLERERQRRGPFEAGPGDRTVETEPEDFRRARRRHDRRSMRSQANDEARRAEITTDYERWMRRPDELDFPGVDSPPDVVPRF